MNPLLDNIWDVTGDNEPSSCQYLRCNRWQWTLSLSIFEMQQVTMNPLLVNIWDVTGDNDPSPWQYLRSSRWWWPFSPIIFCSSDFLICHPVFKQLNQIIIRISPSSYPCPLLSSLFIIQEWNKIIRNCPCNYNWWYYCFSRFWNCSDSVVLLFF